MGNEQEWHLFRFQTLVDFVYCVPSSVSRACKRSSIRCMLSKRCVPFERRSECYPGVICITGRTRELKSPTWATAHPVWGRLRVLASGRPAPGGLCRLSSTLPGDLARRTAGLLLLAERRTPGTYSPSCVPVPPCCVEPLCIRSGHRLPGPLPECRCRRGRR